MEAVYFEGLNCYLGCLINAALLSGIQYEAAFAGLWSESRLTYAPSYNLYFTRRLVDDLNTLGLKQEKLPCGSVEEAAQSFGLPDSGEWMLIEMNAYYLPGNPFYQTLHGSHYFLVSKKQDGSLHGIDPTYGHTELDITPDLIIAHASDIQRIVRVPAGVLQRSSRSEAQIIPSTHPLTLQRISSQILDCTGSSRQNAARLAKYIDGMINNRHLYSHYLTSLQAAEQFPLFFRKEFYQRWTAVKNGLYKASLIPANSALLDELCGCLERLMEEEIRMAVNMVEHS